MNIKYKEGRTSWDGVGPMCSLGIDSYFCQKGYFPKGQNLKTDVGLEIASAGKADSYIYISNSHLFICCSLALYFVVLSYIFVVLSYISYSCLICLILVLYFVFL